MGEPTKATTQVYFIVCFSMSFLQGKTPISFLQELCTKRGITPQYDLIANEGAVHEPTFVFKVTGGEFIGTGKGEHQELQFEIWITILKIFIMS